MIIEYPTYGESNRLSSAEVGKVYIVSLPFAASHPCLTYNTLIAHKNIDGHGKGWTITHLASGKVFSKGPTKKAAIDDAMNVCSLFDNDRLTDMFQRAIADFKYAKGEV